MAETVSEIAQLWNRALAKIKSKINDQRIFDSFLSESYIDSINGNLMTVVVNSGLAATICDSTYRETISSCVEETTGTVFEIKFVQESEVKASAPVKQTKPSFFADAHLEPRFTFDNFVQGPSNREAYQASLMVARNPGMLYSPLFFYSDSGLGKTHLLHAIGNCIRETNPGSKVLYISASDFVDEYVRLATGGFEGEQSWGRYFKSEVDALLIDDIQFLIGKPKTMEMFFIAFQALQGGKKQIVITSDQNPSKLNGLDDRLKTRFNSGLVLEIKRPDLQTSEAILRLKIESSGLKPADFDDDVISFLASRFSSSVRELEGALNRLLFYTINIKASKRITMDVAREALIPLLSSQEEGSKITDTKIISVVANHYSLTPSQLTGKMRTAQIALARHIAMYLIRTILDTPFTKIGDIFGGKDHATVMSAVSKVEKELKTSPEMRKVIEELKEKLDK